MKRKRQRELKRSFSTIKSTHPAWPTPGPKPSNSALNFGPTSTIREEPYILNVQIKQWRHSTSRYEKDTAEQPDCCKQAKIITADALCNKRIWNIARQILGTLEVRTTFFIRSPERFPKDHYTLKIHKEIPGNNLGKWLSKQVFFKQNYCTMDNRTPENILFFFYS